MRFSFAFPPPHADPQKLLYRDRPRGHDESKVYLLNRPLLRQEEEQEVARLVAQGHYLLGICAFQSWPGRIHNPAEHARTRAYDLFAAPYARHLVGFMHNLREPRDVFPDGLPLLSMDFSDYVQVRKRRRVKRFDLLYYAGYKNEAHAGSVAWSRVVKQHDLALSLIHALLAHEPEVRICLVHDSFGIDDPRVIHFDHLPYREFLDLTEESRIMLVPSVLDASPRVITEALCLDTYVMVNERISGGWKYVQPETGAFFNRDNALEVYRSLRARPPAATRAWFLRNYPNQLLEDRFDAWLGQCILDHCIFNRFGRVYSLCADERRPEAERELFGFTGIYGDCVEHVAPTIVPEHPARGRALTHLTALRRARELGLPDVVILEDGFAFIARRPVQNRKIGALLREFPAWDMILFGNRDITCDEPTHDPAVRRVFEAAIPRGYAVHARFYDQLIAALTRVTEAGPSEASAEGLRFPEGNAALYSFRDALGE
jgi:hypothetical protein